MKRSGIILAVVVYAILSVKTFAYDQSHSPTKTWWLPEVSIGNWITATVVGPFAGAFVAFMTCGVILIAWFFIAILMMTPPWLWKWISTGKWSAFWVGHELLHRLVTAPVDDVNSEDPSSTESHEPQPAEIEVTQVEINALNNEPINPEMDKPKPFEPYIVTPK